MKSDIVAPLVIIQSHSYEVLFRSGGFILLVIACIYFFYGFVIIYIGNSKFMNTTSLLCSY